MTVIHTAGEPRLHHVNCHITVSTDVKDDSDNVKTL